MPISDSCCNGRYITPCGLNEYNYLIYDFDSFSPVVNCHFEIKDSGAEEYADYDADAMPSSAIVEDGDES